MLNILFWMVLLFTTAILLYNKWQADAAEREAAAECDRLARNITAGLSRGRKNERLVKHPLDQRSYFVTVKAETPAPRSIHLMPLAEPERKDCEIYDLKGRRVA